MAFKFQTKVRPEWIDYNGHMQDERLSKVVELESTIEGFLSENFPNVSVDLEIPPPEIKTILTTAKIYIDDGSRDLIDPAAENGFPISGWPTHVIINSDMEIFHGFAGWSKDYLESKLNEMLLIQQ